MHVKIEKAPLVLSKKINSYFSLKIPFFWPCFYYVLTLCFIYFYPSQAGIGAILFIGPILSALFRMHGFFVALTLSLFCFIQEADGWLLLSLLTTSFLSYKEAEDLSFELVLLKKEKEELEEAFLKDKQALEKELQKWIEEAKLRRIDKVTLERKLTLLESEITYLNHEKKEKLDSLETSSKTPWESLYKQLKTQFEEKSKILSETRRELFQKEGNLLSFEKEKELEWDKEPLMDTLTVLSKEKEELEDEVTSLEELVLHILSG